MRTSKGLPVGRPALPSVHEVDLSDPVSVRHYLATLTSAVEQHLAQRPTVTTPLVSQLFQGEDGTIYKLDVNPSGVVRVEPLDSVNDRPLPP